MRPHKGEAGEMAMEWMFKYRPAARCIAAIAVIIAAVLPAAAGCSAPGPAAPSAATAASGVPASGHWGTATPVPGLAGRSLNAGGRAGVSSVSCASAGNCTIGGSYRDGHSHGQAYVVSERNGRWGTAIEIPGTARLNAQQIGDTSVSCAGAGNCAARGLYVDGQRRTHLFVLSQRNGRWSAATVVPGTVGGVRAGVYSMWCDSAGRCVAGGVYSDRRGRQQAFVANERNARWAAAVDVLRTSGLNAPEARVTSVSCASAGNCAAGGSYEDGHGHSLVFVASERNGRWGTAIEIPGTAHLNAGGYPQVSSVSCPSARNCAAGGWYLDSSGNRHAFIVSERNGRWGTAIEIPGTRARSWVNSVSCGSAGNCAADGGYIDNSCSIRPFLAGEQNGRWAAIEFPGIASLLSSIPGHAGNAEVSAMSCLIGYCLAGGYYDDYFGQMQAFVVSRP